MDLEVASSSLWALLASLAAAAALYSTSGHGGATAYLALFSLWGVSPPVMRPLALVMNVAVAGLGALRLARAGEVPWRLLSLLLLGSVPAAWLGGLAKLPPRVYSGVLGASLLVAAARLWLPTTATTPDERSAPPWAWTLLGVVLGGLSGLTGIGGGIFLSPVLVLGGFATPRRTAGAAAVFIVVNSLVGLAAQATTGGLGALPSTLPWLLLAVLVGGVVGSTLAAHRLSPTGLRRALGVVLVVSGAKLLAESIAGG